MILDKEKRYRPEEEIEALDENTFGPNLPINVVLAIV